MRKTAAVAAIGAALLLLTGCAQTPSWTGKEILRAGLNEDDAKGIKNFDIRVLEQEGEDVAYLARDIEPEPGIPTECYALFDPLSTSTGASTVVNMTSYITPDEDIHSTPTLGRTYGLLYATEDGANTDYANIEKGFANPDCVSDSVLEELTMASDDVRVDVEELNPHCKLECKALQVHVTTDSQDSTAWLAVMKRGNGIVLMNLFSGADDRGDWVDGFTKDAAVAMVYRQAAKLASAQG